MRAWLFIGSILAQLSLGSAAGLAADDWKDWQKVEEPKAFEVVQYLDLDEGKFVILAAGNDQGLTAGMTLKTYRASAASQLLAAVKGSVWVVTGRLKLAEVQGTHSVALVEEQGSLMSKAFFPKFSGVMAGDLAVAETVALVRRKILTPTVTLSYFDLFEDPKAAPSHFELKQDGIARLKDAAATFAAARVSLLMIEGYTDHKGPASANQVESYQRALTVRQYLIDEFGFDKHRVVAVGYGETEQIDASMAPGYVEANRRIVIKAVPVSEEP